MGAVCPLSVGNVDGQVVQTGQPVGQDRGMCVLFSSWTLTITSPSDHWLRESLATDYVRSDK
jgi:hypothetical protein